MDADGIGQATFHLPVGTVTFMLTDVEGSTRLWESVPDAMGVAVARHYELLDEAIALHGGVRLRTAESPTIHFNPQLLVQLLLGRRQVVPEADVELPAVAADQVNLGRLRSLRDGKKQE